MDAKTMTIFVRANIENLSKNLAQVEKNMNTVFGKNTMQLSKKFALGIGAAAAALGAFSAACINAADKEQETIRMTANWELVQAAGWTDVPLIELKF